MVSYRAWKFLLKELIMFSVNIPVTKTYSTGFILKALHLEKFIKFILRVNVMQVLNPVI